MGISQNGIVQRPQVFDGQGADPTDFAALSNWSAARLNDLILGAWMRTQPFVTGPSSVVTNPNDATTEASPKIFCASAAAGAPKNTGSNNGYGCNAGTIFYVSGAPTVDGLTPKAVPYCLSQNEISGSLAAGNGTNPRFDAIYLRLTDVDGPLATRDFKDAAGAITSQTFATTKQTKLEWSIVQGTPSATPTVPAAPDATWALWGAWYVPKSWNTSFISVANVGTNLLDYRIPIGHVRRYTQTVNNGGLWLAGGSVTAGGDTVTTGATTGFSGAVGAICPVRSGRVLSVTWTASLRHGGGFQKILTKSLFGTGIVTEPPGWASIYGGIHTGDPSIPFGDLDNFGLSGGNWYNASGNLVTTSTSGLALLPLWANGLSSTAQNAPGENAFDGAGAGGGADYTWLASYWCPGASGDIVLSCSFDIAG